MFRRRHPFRRRHTRHQIAVFIPPAPVVHVSGSYVTYKYGPEKVVFAVDGTHAELICAALHSDATYSYYLVLSVNAGDRPEERPWLDAFIRYRSRLRLRVNYETREMAFFTFGP